MSLSIDRSDARPLGQSATTGAKLAGHTLSPDLAVEARRGTSARSSPASQRDGRCGSQADAGGGFDRAPITLPLRFARVRRDLTCRLTRPSCPQPSSRVRPAHLRNTVVRKHRANSLRAASVQARCPRCLVRPLRSICAKRRSGCSAGRACDAAPSARLRWLT